MTASRNQLRYNRNLPNNSLQSCYYQSHLGKIYYLDSCQQNAETIVFLHGFTGSSHDFLSLPDAILSNYRCLIPDLPGHGQTQVLENATVFQAQGQIALLKQWLDSLGESKFHLFGYSMGGRLALQFAVRHTEQIQSLILVSTTPGIQEESIRNERILADKRLAQKILSAESVDFLTEWISQPLFQGIAERGIEFVAQEVKRRLPIQQSGLACSLNHFSPGVMPSVWHQLRDIKSPALVMAGARDQKYLALASEIIKQMPNAKLKILKTSHAPLIESPDLLWKNVTNFIQGE